MLYRTKSEHTQDLGANETLGPTSGEVATSATLVLDIRPHFSYEPPISLESRTPAGDPVWRSECGARGRRLVTVALGRLGHHPAGTTTGA